MRTWAAKLDGSSKSVDRCYVPLVPSRWRHEFLCTSEKSFSECFYIVISISAQSNTDFFQIREKCIFIALKISCLGPIVSIFLPIIYITIISILINSEVIILRKKFIQKRDRKLHDDDDEYCIDGILPKEKSAVFSFLNKTMWFLYISRFFYRLSNST